ncbi:MAG: ABC transporter permease [Clostridiales bacterium]|nr:ABC transporter permease [Clostridiales bacterium]
MQTRQQSEVPVKEKHQSQLVFLLILIAAIVAASVVFNFLTGGRFLELTNILVIISHIVWPSFVAWGLCFLFACGYTDLSIGAVVVLGSFATCIFGNWYGYPGVILGGLIVGTLLVFINFNVFAYTKIPSWIAGISLAMVYEAIAVVLKVSDATADLIYAEMDKRLRILGQVPWSIILLFAGLAAAYFIYNRTTIGLNIRALGGNKNVAQALGINVNKTLLGVGLICGIFIGIASIVQESVAGRTLVKTGLTSINMVFQPLAIVLLAQVMQKRLNIVIAVPICAVIIYAVFNLLTIMGVPSGTLQEAFLGAFLIAFGVFGQRGIKGVVK